MFLFIGDSKGRKYFTTNKFHTKISNGEFFQTMVYVCMCKYVHTSVCVYMNVFVFVCVCVCVCVCGVHTRMSISIHACMLVWN